MLRADERGLSTLEWILLIAAVGGLATIGVIVVRGAVNDTDDRTQTSAELAGEDGALKAIQGKVNRLMFGWRQNPIVQGTDEARFRACQGHTKLSDGVTDISPGRWKVIGEKMGELLELHSELYTFHPVSVSHDVAAKFTSAAFGDRVYVWCRVKSKISEKCASIADETSVSDPPNDGYRDIALYRMTRAEQFNDVSAPNARATTPHNRPLSSTLCKGRV